MFFYFGNIFLITTKEGAKISPINIPISSPENKICNILGNLDKGIAKLINLTTILIKIVYLITKNISTAKIKHMSANIQLFLKILY